MNIAKRATDIEPRTATSRWRDHEHVRGYAALELPFSSGHLLGLRVWPQTDFAPWVSVWHRTPEGEWSIHSDGPSLDATCPRYWKPALERATITDVDVTWTGPTTLRVEMAEPPLTWTMSMTAPRSLRGLNAASAAMPLWTWKVPALRRFREWMATYLLGMGEISLAFTSASGHEAVIMPEELFFVEESTAVLDGEPLGDLVHLDVNPTIGNVPTPTRPIFTLGQAHMRIVDSAEYHRTRTRVLGSTPDGAPEQRSDGESLHA